MEAELPSGRIRIVESVIESSHMRKVPLITEEYYHVFGRGVNKRTIFMDPQDYARFLQSMEEFNTIEPIGSIFENSFRKHESQLGSGASKLRFEKRDKLVEFVCYCLNPNHYHFLLKQVADRGIEKFMHRLCSGFSKYFNNKYQRSGALFQGPFKAVHVDANEYLLHVSAYVNLNNLVHRLGGGASKSSWEEYLKGKRGKGGFCEKEVILSQFQTIAEYKDFAEDALTAMLERNDMEHLLLES
ncbi:MAG: transposase [Candidatus Sungbacteria bacterium]|uniref:Transposase n=1 Tax=Candidatus Sungiibacteriota bacterium TaxID=2750080 RepID=A0A931SDI9_9BACT|nr:transposase [Candidatus Sungbacteria bacterium]